MTETHHMEDTAEFIQLKTQVALIEKCELLVGKMAVLTNDAMLVEISGSIDEFPVPFQKQLLIQIVKEMPLKTVEEVDGWVLTVMPFSDEMRGVCCVCVCVSARAQWI